MGKCLSIWYAYVGRLCSGGDVPFRVAVVPYTAAKVLMGGDGSSGGRECVSLFLDTKGLISVQMGKKGKATVLLQI